MHVMPHRLAVAVAMAGAVAAGSGLEGANEGADHIVIVHLLLSVLRVGSEITRNARIEIVCKYQSCMVSKLRMIWKRTVPRTAHRRACCGQRTMVRRGVSLSQLYFPGPSAGIFSLAFSRSAYAAAAAAAAQQQLQISSMGVRLAAITTRRIKATARTVQ